MRHAPARYALFDGGVIANSPVFLALRNYPKACALYADLGSEAANVGPWLVPADTLIHEWMAASRADENLRAGVSELEVSVDQSELESHLQSLRYIGSLSSGKKYFFRYADARALISLWNALSEAQCSALLGPVVSWQFTNSYGESEQLIAPALPEDTAPAKLPLRLSPPQFDKLLASSRIGELLATTLDMFPKLKTVPVSERLELTKQAHAWLSEHNIHEDSIRLAVTASCLRTQGAALAHQSFAQAVFQASQTYDIDDVLDWSEVGIPDKSNV